MIGSINPNLTNKNKNFTFKKLVMKKEYFFWENQKGILSSDFNLIRKKMASFKW